MRDSLLVTGLSLAVVLSFGCSHKNVMQAREMGALTESQEIELGKRIAPLFEAQNGGVVPQAVVQDIVETAGLRVAKASDRPDLPYTFTVLRSSVPNAFGLPGGKVYITAGLYRLLINERELAAALAHEIGHVAGRHYSDALADVMGPDLYQQTVQDALGSDPVVSAQACEQLATMTRRIQFTMQQEYAADQLGIVYMARAGYNPQGMVDLLQTLERLQATGATGNFISIFQTHPLTSDRTARARQIVGENYGHRSPPDQDRFAEDLEEPPSAAGGAGGEDTFNDRTPGPEGLRPQRNEGQ